MANVFPPLCGGVFVRTILNYRKQRVDRKDLYAGNTDPLSDIPALLALIRVTDPTFQSPKETTIKSVTSTFLNCRDEIPKTLPFTDSGFKASFNGQMRDSYPTLLHRMNEYLEFAIGLDDKYKLEGLCKDLLTIIENDPHCAKAKFNIGPNGEAVTLSNTIYFQSFILGIWHYIIKTGMSNKVDEKMYNAWNKRKDKGTSDKEIKLTIQKDPDEVTTEEDNDEVEAEKIETKERNTKNIEEPEIIEAEEVHSEDYQGSFYDPISKREVLAQFHVENHGSGVAAGVVYGGITIGGKK